MPPGFFLPAILRYDCCVHSVTGYIILVLIAVLAIAFRLAIAGPFGPFAAKLGFLPKSWQRWMLGEPSGKKTN